MSSISKTYEPSSGANAELHDARFRAFTQLQEVASTIRQS